MEIIFDLPGVKAGIVADMSDATDVLLPDQTHSCNVALIDRDGIVPPLISTDAIISLREGLTVGVRTADCVPLLLYAPDIRAVAAIHAGWKGTLGGITTATTQLLIDLGADPQKIEARFGPHICGRCYEVSHELADTFRQQGFGATIIGERHLDLQRVNTMRLTAADVSPANIHPTHICTFTTPVLPSWRRSPTARRLVTSITLV